jgi:hypothetical protein
MKMILFKDTDGITRRIYGRPGKFQHGAVEQNEWVDVQAEFRRADTNAYEDVETFIEITEDANPVYILRDTGDADAWFRLLLYGPITHPVVTVGNCQVELDLDIPENTIVEVSSYPWMRRVVDSNNVNWRAAVIGQTQYLDQLKIPANTPIPLRWTTNSAGAGATGMVTWTELPSTRVVENFDFLDMFNLIVSGSGWWPVHGIPIWGFSLQTGGYLYSPFGICALVDTQHAFNTPGQYSEARIADIWRGTSTIVIKCDNTMTNFCGVQIVKTLGILGDLGFETANDKIRIVTGSAYNNVTVQREFAVPSPGLQVGDTIGIAYDDNSATCFALRNGTQLGSWNDAAGFIQNGVHQGFILNEDDDILNLQFGVGMNSVVAYDANFSDTSGGGTTPPRDPNDLSNRVFLLWRETWHIE